MGVTTNKNSLGLIVFVVSLGVFWNLRALLRDKKAPHRTRHLVAQGTLLMFGLLLLQMAHCATAIACLALGSGLMLATGLRAISNRPARVHAFCLAIMVVGSVILLIDGVSMVTGALGRHTNLTGRTEIWKASIAAADNPVFGTGFESFWNTNVEKVAAGLRGYYAPTAHNLVSAHNGYIEVYLDLGWIGVCLIAVILATGYRDAIRTFRRNHEVGSLLLAYVATCAFYSITEVGFRVLTPSWIFLLLAVVSANGFATGLIGGQKHRIAGSRVGSANSVPAMSDHMSVPVLAHGRSVPMRAAEY
jgi:O-antigen ligase